MTPIGQVGSDHPLCQQFMETENASGGVSKTIRMPCKLTAIDKRAKMLGWYQPEEFQHEVEASDGGADVEHQKQKPSCATGISLVPRRSRCGHVGQSRHGACLSSLLPWTSMPQKSQHAPYSSCEQFSGVITAARSI
jgi:hypothetical protein